MSYNNMLNRAIELHNAGALNEAMEIYLKILEAVPEQSDVWNLLGLISQSKGDLLQAQNAFLNAIKYAKIPFAPHYFNLGLVYKELQKKIEAEEAMERAVKLNPQFKEAWNYLGIILEQNQKHRKAIQCFCKALDIDMDYIEARAHLFYYTKDYEGLLDLAEKEDDQKAGILAAEIVDDIEKKEYYLRKTLANHPYSTQVMILLAEVLFSMKKNDESLQLYYKVMNLDSSDIRAYLGAADIHLNNQEFDKAIKLYEKSFAIRRDIGGTYLNYGIALYKSGRVSEALEAYRNAVILCSDDEKICYNLALILKENGDYEEALGLMFNAYLKDKENKQYQINIMETLEELYTKNAELALKIALNWQKLDAENIFSRKISAAFSGGKGLAEDDKIFSKILFDNFADNYDEVMAKLDLKLVDKFIEVGGEAKGNVLDLGCGTGLLGTKLKNNENRFVGVDISPKMLKVAQDKKVYDELIVSDVSEYVKKNPIKKIYNQVLMFDVSGYIGDMREIFKKIYGTEFWFSFEKADENRQGEFFLSARGRYQHKESYIKKALQMAHFKEISFFDTVLRNENGEKVLGFLVRAK